MAKAVNWIRPEVVENAKRWKVVEHCVIGSHAIKGEGTTYLPQPNADDTSEENKLRYDAYLRRALFYNATGRTRNGLVGQVLAKDPQLVLPPVLEGMRFNVNGRGSTAVQFAKNILNEMLNSGRGGVMADFPDKADGTPVTMEDVQVKKVAPFLRFYKAADIINWRTAVEHGVKYLKMVVMRERDEVTDDGEFGMKIIERYRVLSMEAGSVLCRVYEQKAENTEEFTEISRAFMTNQAGANLTQIPFTFIGVDDNSEDIGTIPLLDMARVNLSHFYNSADAEDSAYLVGQPTPVFSGLTKEWVEEVLKGKVRLGSRSAVFLPENASAELLQATENNLPITLMERKEKQMVALGAKLVQDKQTQRTATETSIDATADMSVLGAIVHNINSALAFVMPFCLAFLDATTKPNEETLLYELNTDFDLARMDPSARGQLIAEWQAGAIDFEEMRYGLKKAGIAYKDDDEVQDSIEEEMDHRQEREVGKAGELAEATLPPEDKKAKDKKAKKKDA